MRLREIYKHRPQESNRHRNDYYVKCLRHGIYYNGINCEYCVDENATICEQVGNDSFFMVLRNRTK